MWAIMYKLLIVDDDLPVRMDLRTLLSWKDFGIELVDEATNGREGLEKIRQFNPDIVILDLGMPVMNGLEVIRILKEEGFNGKIIVLSCHDDFDSVSEALKLGAADYILKHLLKAESLAAVINKVIEMLVSENSRRQEIQSMEKLSKMSISALKNKFVKDLISGNFKDKDQIGETIKSLGIDSGLNKYVIGLLELDDFYQLKEKYPKKELSSLLKSTEELLEMTLKSGDSVFGSIAEGEYCIVMCFDNVKSVMYIHSKIHELCESILTNMNNYLNIKVSIGLGRICDNPFIADECYAKARMTLDGKLYLGKNRVIHYSEVENYNSKLGNFLFEFDDEISQIVHTDEKRITEYINRIFTDISNRNISTEQIRVLCFELLLLSNRIAKENGISYENVYQCDYVPYNLVMNLETMEDIKNWFISVCVGINRSICDRIRKPAVSEIRTEVKKALEYIDNNYTNDINLQEVADFVGLSRNYFSHIFKQEMSDNFVDFLTRYRIEKAKYLLTSTSMKIYEVGNQCGFYNYRYFTRLFKMHTGFSPIEFKTTHH